MFPIKKVLIVITTIVVLITTSVAFPFSNAHAIGPVLKVVGGEALDQILQGIAYKAGQSFNDETTIDKARSRWNLEAYEQAEKYEQMLNEEEKQRWDKFNNEVKNAKVEPIPGKPGLGKVILSGAAFLTGVDLIYNAYSAFQQGYDSGQPIEGMDYNLYTLPDAHPSVSFTYYYGKLSGANYAFYNLTVQLSNGEVYEIKDEPLQYASNAPFAYKVISASVIEIYYKGSILTDTVSLPKTISTDTGLPSRKTMHITPNDLGLVVPQAFETIPKTNELPDISQIPNVHPDSIIEIVVPTEPGIIPNPEEVPAITIKELEDLINPIPNPETDPETDPDKPVIPQPGTDKPPYERPDSDPRPGTDPDTNPGTEPTPEYPEKTETTETPGLFEKLWEWLKAILDVLFKILAAILALPFTLLELLWDFLFDIAKALFVPSDGYWDDNINELKKVIWSDEMDEMIDKFGAVGDGSGGNFKDIVVSLMGVDGLVVIDADSINSILDNIHSWVRGVFYPFLILFNLNSFYKLIRGVSLVEATRGLANRAKEE